MEAIRYSAKVDVELNKLDLQDNLLISSFFGSKSFNYASTDKVT